MMRALAGIALIAATVAAVPAPLDSQIVLERYELALSDLPVPESTIVSYTVSQAGPTDIEQGHRLYREGLAVRDETISVDGAALKQKIVRIGRHDDRYSVARIAPRSATYGFLFVRAAKRDGTVYYEFEATPLVASSSGFVVTRIIIDGRRFLPRSVAFKTSSETSNGSGVIEYAPSGRYWVPVQVNVDATVQGKPARERIAWSDYRFPPALPQATFQGLQPVPSATPPQ